MWMHFRKLVYGDNKEKAFYNVNWNCPWSVMWRKMWSINKQFGWLKNSIMAVRFCVNLWISLRFIYLLFANPNWIGIKALMLLLFIYFSVSLRSGRGGPMLWCFTPLWWEYSLDCVRKKRWRVVSGDAMFVGILHVTSITSFWWEWFSSDDKKALWPKLSFIWMVVISLGWAICGFCYGREDKSMTRYCLERPGGCLAEHFVFFFYLFFPSFFFAHCLYGWALAC